MTVLRWTSIKSIESLGHSVTAYHTAMNRLERAFGGERRQIAIHLQEIDNFRPVRHGNSRDIREVCRLAGHSCCKFNGVQLM